MSRASMQQKSGGRYVAFLRGINVGGHAAIKMADLKAAFAKMGFGGVKTVLASGNVIFTAWNGDEKALATKIASGLERVFKRNISVLLRSMGYLQRLRLSEPFAGIESTPDIQLYVTFLSHGSRPPAVAVPYVMPGNELHILRASATEVFSIVDLSKGKGTPEAMSILEKKFGSSLTTRNWNTVLKILK